MVAQTTNLEEKIDKALFENSASLEFMWDTLSKVKKVQQDLVLKHAFIKERLDMSCVKLEIVTDNSNQTGSYILEQQWTLKEVLICINWLSNMIDLLMDAYEPTRGKRVLAKNDKVKEIGMMSMMIMDQEVVSELFKEKSS